MCHWDVELYTVATPIILMAFQKTPHLGHCCGDHISLLIPFTLKSSYRSIVCYFHTFGNNLGVKRKFAKYFKESCCLFSDQHFSFKCFKKKCFCKENISKIVRPLLAALSVNGLETLYNVAPKPIDRLYTVASNIY